MHSLRHEDDLPDVLAVPTGRMPARDVVAAPVRRGWQQHRAVIGGAVIHPTSDERFGGRRPVNGLPPARPGDDPIGHAS